MSAQLNHTIVWCRDKRRSTHFLTDILGLPAPGSFGPMLVVSLSNGVSLDFYERDEPISTQHYAFLVGDGEFDRAFARIREQGLTYWADPAKRRAGEINTHGGGRGVYFNDPDGHFLELLTRPYDLGAAS
ncbi:cysteine transferase [Burkholderia pseudomallei]|uniref:VOC family protein n=1 Tax=Burkholderia pseudomallei TaxID=28450 RepID=UPI000F04B6A2|nr:VOC family protein [Burkholderia pseudomallei]VBE50798.1 cysteine transferase [Burkholderia pseudomallei]